MKDTPASSVLMVAPNTFGFDTQTAVTNAFQRSTNLSPEELTRAAMGEFDACVKALKLFGVHVAQYSHQLGTPRPNAVFPNNWLSTWPDGTIYLYPMATQSRRVERSAGVLDYLKAEFEVRSIVDISQHEERNQFLESTGVMVFDHANKVVYACESARCDKDLFRSHAGALGYRPVLFQASDPTGAAIYHTNVMMGIQRRTAVIYADGIRDEDQRHDVIRSLGQTGHEVIELTYEQLMSYCGNIIQLANAKGETAILMSESAYQAFTPDQRELLARDNELIHVPVPTIQAVGGGSVRCMVAEIYLHPTAVVMSGASGLGEADE